MSEPSSTPALPASAAMGYNVEMSGRLFGESIVAGIEAGSATAPGLSSLRVSRGVTVIILTARVAPTTTSAPPPSANTTVARGVTVINLTAQVAATTTSAPPPSANTTPNPPSTTAWVPLTSFEYFPKLPFELRRMIFVLAIEDCPPRILAVQPQYHEHPPLVHTCSEARDACTKYYRYCASRQRCKAFRYFMDYSKDVFYLNHPFSLLGDKCILSPLQATYSIYPEQLKLIQSLAMNLKEVRHYAGSHRGRNTVWAMLSRWCPVLEQLIVVVNNFPTNGLFLDFIGIHTRKEFQDLIPKSKQFAIQEIHDSLAKAKVKEKDKSTCLKNLDIRLVLVDETARKVKTKMAKFRIAEAWRLANRKVDGVSEVDQIAAGLDRDGGDGASSGGVKARAGGNAGATAPKQDKKGFVKAKLLVKGTKASDGKLWKKKPAKKSADKIKANARASVAAKGPGKK